MHPSLIPKLCLLALLAFICAGTAQATPNSLPQTDTSTLASSTLDDHTILKLKPTDLPIDTLIPINDEYLELLRPPGNPNGYYYLYTRTYFRAAEREISRRPPHFARIDKLPIAIPIYLTKVFMLRLRTHTDADKFNLYIAFDSPYFRFRWTINY